MIYFILPCFNEEKNIVSLLNNIHQFYKKKKIEFHIIVINDGSSDRTYYHCKIIKNKITNVITLINHKKNLGLGKALKTGFNYVLKISKPNDIIITLDSDNSHTAQNSYDLLIKIYKGYDMVIASRYTSQSKIHGLNLLRKILSIMSSIIFKIAFTIKNVNDYTSGFRAFKVKKIRNIMLKKNFFTEKGFSVTADILLKLYLNNKNLLFAEVPLILRYDKKKGDSKMKIIATIIQNLKLIFLRRFFFV
jgi:dolichol-phosphate mannosyltransferase